MSQTKLVTKSGDEVTYKNPKGFFYNPEYAMVSLNYVNDLGHMDSETKKWFLDNLSQNDLAAWAKDYQLKVRSGEGSY